MEMHRRLEMSRVPFLVGNLSEVKQRVVLANDLIRCVGSHGRRFLSYTGSEATRYARFELYEPEKSGPYVGFHDAYTQMSMVLADRAAFVGLSRTLLPWMTPTLLREVEKSRWHFSNGSTVRAFLTCSPA